MAIDKENLKKGFQSLSTRYGGSLLQEKKLLSQEEVVVFIGLGGLGCRAINAIKAAAADRLDNPDRRFFLAVDTCEKDMDNISEATVKDIENPDADNNLAHGCIAEEEKLPLYNESFKIKTLGHDVDSWINRDQLGEVTIDNKGAQGIRQIGRVMLMAGGNYDRVYAKLTAVLTKAKKAAEDKDTGMKIYIIAGISGGTGSGTIVDFTYMVKRAISGFRPTLKKIDAVIFTPDVQYDDYGIDENKKKGLQANFYAAIKEIDFFFNNRARKVSYTCPYSKDEDAYKEDIFDFCTLISRRAQGIDIAEDSNGVIKKVAEAITFEISGIEGKTNKGVGQSYSAFFSNVYNNFQLWWPANSGTKGLQMPDWAPSRYSSLAYSSFYIPRDELVAYCANRLMERLKEHWDKSDITAEELQKIFRRNNIISNRAFAGKLFSLSGCEDKFETENKDKPADGFGKVRNCCSYLDLMKSIAEEEGSKPLANNLFQLAENKQKSAFINPIISLVDKAFTDEARGPVYAINLLSAGIGRNYSENSGILSKLNKLITDIDTDAKTWELELEQIYSTLETKAESYDGRLKIDAQDLALFTDECRAYGEDLLKCRLLSDSKAKEYLKKIYTELNDKNNKVFNIYTYALEYLVATLKKDAGYVTDTHRHREGQTTVFSFDLENFNNGQLSNKFKRFFDSVVDTKDLDKESKSFVSIIFGRLKQLLDPPTAKKENTDIRPEDVISIIRDYFNTSFGNFTKDIIEKFCVVAYSDVDAAPETITKIWSDPARKDLALKKAADAINAKISKDRKIMLTCADDARDLQNFCSYETSAALHDTPDINNFLDKPFVLEVNWSEYIGFKRIFGFPLNLLADLDAYKKEYDAQAITAGIHLDEMNGPEDEFGNWRYALPEPYSYKTAKFLGKYKEGGNDTAYADKLHMEDLLKLAKEAEKLGLLTEKTNDTADADDNNAAATDNTTYYELTWKLLNGIDDFEDKKSEIYENIRNAVSDFRKQERSFDFFDILNKAGYKTDDAAPIQWTFERPEYNVMKSRTDMGDDVDFGNFIILLRSNPYWEAHLRKGVKLFGKLHEIYTAVVDEFAAEAEYNDKIIDFMKAIRVGRIVPFYDKNLFTGYKIKVSDKPEEDIFFINSGMDAFDQKFLIYHCFTDKYMGIAPAVYTAMNTLTARDFNIDHRVDFSEEAIKNVQWFIDKADAALKDENTLNHYDAQTMKKIFTAGLKYSGFMYSLPSPSMERKDIDAVINNLKGFYKQLRDYLTANLPDVQPEVKTAEAEPAVPAAGTAGINSWVCSCGAVNTGNFCQMCGKQKPEPQASWKCSCGAVNTGNFCQMCGKKKPEASDSWKCSCGAVNTGNFCQMCGKKKDAAPTEVICKNCGWKAEDSSKAGKFCPKCGTALN